MSRPVIDYDDCNGCGVCIKICPANAIESDSNNMPRIPEDIESKCLGCSACLRRCPADCIHIMETNHKKEKRKGLFRK